MRCLEIGLSLNELEFLTIGMVDDIFIEKHNDGADYAILPTQEDFDRF